MQNIQSQGRIAIGGYVLASLVMLAGVIVGGVVGGGVFALLGLLTLLVWHSNRLQRQLLADEAATFKRLGEEADPESGRDQFHKQLERMKYGRPGSVNGQPSSPQSPYNEYDDDDDDEVVARENNFARGSTRHLPRW